MRPRLAPQRIVERVAFFFGLEPLDLVGRSRRQELVLARYVAAHLLKRHTPLSLSGIGRVLGGKDHSTILHGLRVLRRRRAQVAPFLDWFEADLAGVAEPLAVCRGCGCHDLRACPGGCAWVQVDYAAGSGLCSSCAPALTPREVAHGAGGH